jgi:hypothetical protein
MRHGLLIRLSSFAVAHSGRISLDLGASVAIKDRADGGARPLDAPSRLDIGGEQAAVAVQRAIELYRKPRAIVLHQRKFFLRIAARAILPGAALDRRVKQIEGGAQPLQGRFKKINAH